MKTINREKILQEAEKVVTQYGMEKASISLIAKSLGVSHAALYKHFKNKEDILTTLALRWLRQILDDVYQFDGTSYDSKLCLIHDWLWKLSLAKRHAYQENPEMFALYTAYIDQTPPILALHTEELITSLSQTLNYQNQNILLAILEAFTVFSAPAFALSWGWDVEKRFEKLWQLVAPGLMKCIESENSV